MIEKRLILLFILIPGVFFTSGCGTIGNLVSGHPTVSYPGVDSLNYDQKAIDAYDPDVYGGGMLIFNTQCSKKFNVRPQNPKASSEWLPLRQIRDFQYYIFYST